jgi:hypothetical protein
MFRTALFYYAFYFLIKDKEGIKNLSSVFPGIDLVILESKNISNPSLNPIIKKSPSLVNFIDVGIDVYPRYLLNINLLPPPLASVSQNNKF